MSRLRQAERLTAVTGDFKGCFFFFYLNCVCVYLEEDELVVLVLCGGCLPGIPSPVVTGVVGLLQLTNESQ